MKGGEIMAEVMTGVNGQMIRWARESYNMSIEETALALGVDVHRYEMWENGKEFPTYAKLKKISDVLHKPSAIFFFPEPPHINNIKGNLRTLPCEVSDNFSKQVIQQFEKAQVYQMDLHELYGDRISILSERNAFPSDQEELCKYFRRLLKFPIEKQKTRRSDKTVFEIFRNGLYDLGIYVFKDAFRDNTISGLCLNDQQYPIIIINNAMSFARQNFTLFHELFHLISDTSGAEIIKDDYYSYLNTQQTAVEKACDSFANEFLVPMADFKYELEKKPLNENRIVELSTLYSVSKEAIMYKLYSMGLITSEEYVALKEVFYGEAIRNGSHVTKNEKSHGNYYFTKLSYLGSRYTGDVFRQYFSGHFDGFKASEMLHSKVDNLPKLETAYFRGAK